MRKPILVLVYLILVLIVIIVLIVALAMGIIAAFGAEDFLNALFGLVMFALNLGTTKTHTQNNVATIQNILAFLWHLSIVAVQTVYAKKKNVLTHVHAAETC